MVLYIMTKNKTTVSACVIGADLDISLVRGLVQGDHVLCEMNGARIFSNLANPLVADDPWVVVSNNAKKLVLRHPSVSRNLTLHYSKLLRLKQHEPAVFMIHDPYLAPGRIYVILQFVSHRLPSSEIDHQFPMAFDAAAVLAEDRTNVINAIVEKIAEFDYPGWGYMGVCRYSLRSNIRVPIISGFRDRDWKIINEQNDAVLLRMMREMNWLPYLLAQSNPYCEATISDAPYKKVTGDNALPSSTDE